MSNGQNQDLQFIEPIDKSVLAEKHLPNVVALSLGDVNPAFGERGNLFSFGEDLFDPSSRSFRIILGDESCDFADPEPSSRRPKHLHIWISARTSVIASSEVIDLPSACSRSAA